MIKKVTIHDYPQSYAEQYARECAIKINEIIDKLEGAGWTDKHTKIAKESNEKFKTHTKDQEVDI